MRDVLNHLMMVTVSDFLSKFVDLWCEFMGMFRALASRRSRRSARGPLRGRVGRVVVRSLPRRDRVKGPESRTGVSGSGPQGGTPCVGGGEGVGSVYDSTP